MRMQYPSILPFVDYRYRPLKNCKYITAVCFVTYEVRRTDTYTTKRLRMRIYLKISSFEKLLVKFQSDRRRH
jgi:hypothetical protein